LSGQSSRSYLVIAAAIVIAGVLISASVLVAIGGTTKTTTTTTTKTSVSTSTATVTGNPSGTMTMVSSSSGLELEVDLNATVTAPGGAIGAQLTLFNSLDQNLSLVLSYPANSTISDWNSYDTDCGGSFFYSMIGYALFQGYYSASNISLAGSPLQLGPQLVTSCIMMANPDSVVFLPDSNTGVLYSPFWPDGNPEQITMSASTGSCLSTSPGSYSCGVSKGLSGYWNTTAAITLQDATIGSPYFRYFSPSEYTLAVQDMWNQTVYVHFHVVSALGSPVEAVSVVGPIPPYNPGGPAVSVTLKNVGDAPITFLNATLAFVPPPTNPGGVRVPYSFSFNVSSAHPLQPGQSIQDTRTLIGAGFETDLSYPLTISGTTADGTGFSYTLQVQVVPPVSSS